jgi:tetratricopeptide (TPR) repeat protein
MVLECTYNNMTSGEVRGRRKRMRKALLIVLAGAALLMAASCKSTPPEEAVPLPETELAKAKELKAKADLYKLGPLAQAEYTAAENDLKAGEEAYGKDNAASKTSLDKAISGYQAVIAKAGPLYLGTIHDKTAAAKKAADDLKSSVAVKDDYAKAQAVYDRAVAAKTSGDLETATKDYEEARKMFEAVAKIAAEKRDKALAAGADAEKAKADAEAKAAEAQKALDAETFGK